MLRGKARRSFTTIGEKVEPRRPIWGRVVKSEMLKTKKDKVRASLKGRIGNDFLIDPTSRIGKRI